MMVRVVASVMCLAAASVVAQEPPTQSPHIILVMGAPGNAEYAEQFSEWAGHWQDVAKQSGATLVQIGTGEDQPKPNDRERFEEAVQATDPDAAGALWIVMIGHGTYARQVAKFNLRGPDISASDLARWLEPVKRPTIVVNCASSSAPFINKLSATNRVVVTSTKSGSQYNFSRFGDHFARAIASPDSDLDHDDEVSVHEAFLRASAEVRQFYESEGRIATEHALIDDNGDGRGTPARMFRGVRPVSKAKDGAQLDGKKAIRITLSPAAERLPLTTAEWKRRDELETELEKLHAQKDKLSSQEYDTRIEPIMIELANIYRAAEAR